VQRVLAAKGASAAANVSAWKRRIDQRVYRLYGLTAEEIKIVEGGLRMNSHRPRFSPGGAPSL
jgi:hypothetical protein